MTCLALEGEPGGVVEHRRRVVGLRGERAGHAHRLGAVLEEAEAGRLRAAGREDAESECRRPDDPLPHEAITHARPPFLRSRKPWFQVWVNVDQARGAVNGPRSAPLQRACSRIASRASRSCSLRRSVSRLSWSFLPWTRASSTLIRLAAKIERERHDGQPLGQAAAEEAVDLAPREQELARPVGQVVLAVAVAVGADVGADQPGLAAAELDERLAQLDPAGAGRLDLGAGERDPGLDPLEHASSRRAPGGCWRAGGPTGSVVADGGRRPAGGESTPGPARPDGCYSPPGRMRRLRHPALLLACSLAAPRRSAAGRARHRRPRASPLDGGQVLVELPARRTASTPETRERIESGLPTGFIYELELARDRKRWWDDGLARARLEVVAMYNAVTREYLVNTKQDGKLIDSRTVRDAGRARARA